MIVLDTHAWIWWMSQPARLGKAAAREIATADRVGIPAVACFEFAAAVSKGRISLDRSPLDWIERALDEPRVQLLPLTPSVAVKATQLGTFHGDPADRLIVATALLEASVLVTKDGKIRRSGLVNTVW